MMAIRRRRHHLKIHSLFFFFHSKPITHLHQHPLFLLHSKTSPLLQTTLLTKPTVISNTLFSTYSSLTPSSNNSKNEVIERLIVIFTKRLYIQNKEELQVLGEKINPGVVESVLKGFKSWRIANDFFLWASQQKGYVHNCYTYNTMASIHSRFGKTTRLKFLANDVVNSRCQMTPGALGFFIRCLSSHGLVDEAIYFFQQSKRLRLCVVNSYSYNCLIEALAKSGRFELIEMWLGEMRGDGWDVDKFTLTPILQAYCNAGKFKEALIVFNRIFDRGWVDEHVFTILMVSFSKWGEVDKAFELVEKMEGLNMNPNEKTMCSLIHGFAKESRVDKALQLFEKMQILAFNPDLPLYSVLIEGLCKKKELDKALQLYTQMKTTGIYPDVHVYRILISSFCLVGDFVTVNNLLEEGVEGLDVGAIVLLYNAVLDGLVSCGLAYKAYLLIRAMMGTECVDEAVMFKGKVSPNNASFFIVIDGLCKTEKLDEALILYRGMIQMGCERNVLLYNNVIKALCNSDRLEESFEILGEMKESGLRPTEFTHNCIFGCLCRRESVMALLDLMKEMRVCGHEPWIKHSSGLIKQLCSRGDAIKACDFLADMAREGFLPDIIAYSAAIDGLFKIREVNRAMKLFHDISSSGHGPDVVAYNIVIDGLCKQGRVIEATVLFNEMLEKGLLPSVVTYNSMIDGLCKANELDQAFCCFKQMVDEAREPTVVTYTTLIDGLCNAGRPDDALVLWNEMREKGCIPNRIAYMALIHGLCKCSKSDMGHIYFKEMKEIEMRPDPYVYVALISGSISNGNLLLALEIMKEMVQNKQFPVPSDNNYCLMIDAVSKLSENPTTSLDMKNLTLGGGIPAICSVSKQGGIDGLDPNG